MRHNSHIKIDEKEESELYKFIENSHKKREKKRAMGILLNSQGVSVFEVSKKLHACTDAVYNWIISYKSGGVQALVDKPLPGRPKKLKSEHQEDIKEVLKKSS